MAISRVKTWTTNEDLTSSDLNSEFNQVMNNAANTGSAETISARYTFSAGVILDELVATNAAGAGNIKISEFRWDPASGTAADGDGMYIDWVADDAGGTETIMARTGVELTDTDATGEDSEFEIHTMIAATLTKVASFGSAGTTFNTAVTVGVNDTGKDVKFFGATSGQYMLWDESADELVLAGDSKLSFHDAAGGENIIASADGHLEINAGTTLDITATTIDLNGAVAMNGATTGGTNITISGELDAATLDISGNADIDGTTNLDAVDIDGAVQIDATVSVGVDDQGYDVKFFGDTASAYLRWDTSADKLLTAGGATIDIVKDKLLIGGTAVTTTAAELNVLDAVTAGTVAASKAVVVDSNKDAASFRNITLTGELDAATLDISGNADIDGTLEADAYTVDGTALNEYIADTVGAMVTSNTETNIAVTYQDGDNTLDFAISSIDGTTVGASSASTGAFTTLSATGNVSFDGGTFVFNEAGADKDFRIEGDSNQNLFFADASADCIGIGTAAPDRLLTVKGALGLEATNSTNDWVVYTYTDNTLRINYYGAGNDEITVNTSGVVDIGGSFECNQDGVVKWGSSKDFGQLTWDTGKAIIAAQSGKAMELQSAGTAAVTIDTSQNVGIGTASPASTLDVRGAVSVQGPYDGTARLIFEKTSGDGNQWEIYPHTSGLAFYNRDDNKYGLWLGDDQKAAIGHETSPNATLSLNQGTDSGVIFTCKTTNDSFNTGLSSGAHTTLETDDYFAISKISATMGGARLMGVAEDAAQAQTVDIVGYGGTPETGKAITNNALITVRAYEHDGSNALANITADGNVFCVQSYLSGSTRTRFLVDEDGDIYAAQDAVTGLSVIDDYDDVALISALDYARDPEGVIKTDFEDFLKYNEKELVETKILGAPLAEGGMTNVTQLQRLHNGAIRQLGRMLNETRMELAEARKQINQLAA